MRFFLRLLVLAVTAVVLYYGCDDTGVEPSDEVPVLSNTWTSYDSDTRQFFASVTLTLPADVASLDSIWTELYLAIPPDTAADTALTSYDLVDDATNGDILPGDGVYSRQFDSPLLADEPAPVRFAFYAQVDDSLYQTADTWNLPPFITAISATDSLPIPSGPPPDYTLDYLTATVEDPNSLDDIRSVSFTVLKPDGTLSNKGQPLYMADNGEDVFGDAVAGDGIYSLIIKLDNSTAAGAYVYRFTAEDFSGAVSDTVKHTVVLY